MTREKIIAILVAVLVFAGSIFGAYVYGRTDGNKICVASGATAYQEGVENNANIDRQVDRMVEPDIDNALSSRWMH